MSASPTQPSTAGSSHPDLQAAQALAYTPSGLVCTNVLPEAESADYGAHTLLLGGLRVCFRMAKTTPTKVGQFVTVWKRVGRGPIQPFDLGDPVDLFVVSTRSGPHFGQFVFPKAALATHGVVAQPGKDGKRALRVYPPWDTPTSRQALATQAWQRAYFLDLSDHHAVDLARAKHLLAAQR